MRTAIRLFLLGCMLATFMFANAQAQYYYNDRDTQSVIFGLRAGLAVSGHYNQDSEKSQTGIDIGLTIDIRLSGKVFLLTGLDYVTKGTKTKDGEEWLGPTEDYMGSLVRHANFLQLPLRVGYQFAVADDFYIMPYAGPYMAYGLGGKTKYTYVYIDNNETTTDKRPTFDGVVNRFDYGVGLGVNLDYKKIVLSLEYDWGLQRYVKKEAGYNDAKFKCMTITLGYKF